MINKNPVQPEQMYREQVGTHREVVGTAGLRVVGIDPGLGHLGIAVVHLHPFSARLLVIETKAADKKRKLRVMDDVADRVHLLARAILDAAQPDEPGLLAIGIESTALPMTTSKKTVQGLGRVRGMVDGLTAAFNVPVVEETPQGLKKWACGTGSASKDDVIRSMQQRLDGRSGWPAKQKDWEHAADALVAALIAAESAPVTAALRAVGVEYRAPWRDSAMQTG